jgi:hypothetical protein
MHGFIISTSDTGVNANSFTQALDESKTPAGVSFAKEQQLNDL